MLQGKYFKTAASGYFYLDWQIIKRNWL